MYIVLIIISYILKKENVKYKKDDLVIYKNVDKYENSYNYNDLDNNNTSREL